METFKNSKLYLFVQKYTKQIVISLVLLVIAVGLFFTVGGSLSDADHKEFVYIYSDNSDYLNGDPGAWILYKNAYLQSIDKLRVRYQLNSNNLISEKDKDVVFVIDNAETSLYAASCYGHGSKGALEFQSLDYDSPNYSCLLYEISQAIDTLINYEVDLDNKAAIITYNDDYEILSGLTNNVDLLNNTLDGIEAEGYTDYLKALEAMEEFLSHYEHTNDRELKFVLYVGNVSKSNNFLEKAKYDELKAKYPFIKIYALHNVVDNEVILEKIKNISDAQYLIGNRDYYRAEVESRSNKLQNNTKPSFLYSSDQGLSLNSIFNQVIFSKDYSQFKIIDTINNEFFNFNYFKIIEMNNGSVDYQGNTLTWTLDRKMLSGDKVFLEVELGVNNNAILTDNLVPVSSAIQIKSIIEGAPDENINSNLTPYINFYNKVVYYLDDLPSVCDKTPIPDEAHIIGEMVDTTSKVPSCTGYTFIKWNIKRDLYWYDYSEDVTMTFGLVDKSINTKFIAQTNELKKLISRLPEGEIYANIRSLNIVDGRFNMPGYDVYLTPVFEKVSINKGADTVGSAILATGPVVNNYIKGKMGCSSTATYCGSLTSFKKASELPDDTSIIKNLAADNSDYPIYMWISSDKKTLYFYSEAEKLYLNPNSSALFSNFYLLTDIADLSYFEATNLRNISNMFQYCSALEDISPLVNWNVSNVINMSNLFASTKVHDLTPISNWDVSNVTNMSYIFLSTKSNLDLTPISGWDTSKVSLISGMFQSSEISNIDPIANWDLSKVVDMSYFIYGSSIESLAAFDNFDLSNVENIDSAFANCSALKDLTIIKEIDTAKLISAHGFIGDTKSITDFSALDNWDTSKLVSMEGMFSGVDSIDFNVFKNWDVSNVTNMQDLFSYTKNIDLSPISGWNTSSLKYISYMFYNSEINNIDPIANWDLSKVENMSYFMYGSSNIESLSAFSNTDLSSVTNVESAFRASTSLKDLTMLKNVQSSKLKSIYNLCTDCRSLTDLSALSNWDTKNIQEMVFAFYGCTSLTDISPLANWNVSRVESFTSMFDGDASIANPEAINNWNINKNASFVWMFHNVSTRPVFIKFNGGWNDEGTYYPEVID